MKTRADRAKKVAFQCYEYKGWRIEFVGDNSHRKNGGNWQIFIGAEQISTDAFDTKWECMEMIDRYTQTAA